MEKSFKLGFKTICIDSISGKVSGLHKPVEKFQLRNERGSNELVELERQDRVQLTFGWKSDHCDAWGSNFNTALITLNESFNNSGFNLKAGDEATLIRLSKDEGIFKKEIVLFNAAIIGNSSGEYHFVGDSADLSVSLCRTEFVENILGYLWWATAIGIGIWVYVTFGSIFSGCLAGLVAFFIGLFLFAGLYKSLEKLMWEPLGRNYESKIRREIISCAKELIESKE